MTNTDMSKEREAFEAWHRTTNWPSDLGRHEGRYMSNIADAAWEAWQARASLSANAGEPTEADEWKVRGYLAKTLKCWHRLTGEEAAELVAMTLRLSGLYPTPQPAPPTPQAEGWMPIETAPGDMGAYLFLCGRVAVEGFIDATGTYCVRQEAGSGWRKMWRNPTHWMPIPPPPTSSADSRKGD